MATPIPENRAHFTTWSIAAATGGHVARGDGRAAVGITTDSRAVKAGAAFVALRGENQDGHRFLDAAVAAGAGIVVVERGRASQVTSADVIEVEDTLRA